MADAWWDRPVSRLVHRLFFDHFSDTSFAAEEDGRLVGFLIGFVSQSRAGEAYVHMLGVAPEHRATGLGRELYERFFAVVQERDCTVVRAITSPVNEGSIAFHRSLGFEVEPRDDRVLFVKHLG